jgi:hypothetical protein
MKRSRYSQPDPEPVKMDHRRRKDPGVGNAERGVRPDRRELLLESIRVHEVLWPRGAVVGLVAAMRRRAMSALLRQPGGRSRMSRPPGWPATSGRA